MEDSFIKEAFVKKKAEEKDENTADFVAAFKVSNGTTSQRMHVHTPPQTVEKYKPVVRERVMDYL